MHHSRHATCACHDFGQPSTDLLIYWSMIRSGDADRCVHQCSLHHHHCCHLSRFGKQCIQYLTCFGCMPLMSSSTQPPSSPSSKCSHAQGTHKSLKDNAKATATVSGIINGTGSLGKCMRSSVSWRGWVSSIDVHQSRTWGISQHFIAIPTPSLPLLPHMRALGAAVGPLLTGIVSSYTNDGEVSAMHCISLNVISTSWLHYVLYVCL